MPHDDPIRNRRQTSDERQEARTQAFMSCDAWLDFHCELYDVLSHRELRVARVDPGAIRLVDGRSLDLIPLVAQCSERPAADWRGLIERHLDRLVTLLGGPRCMVAGPISSFDLRVRLLPASPIERPVLDSLGVRWLTADLVAALVVVDAHASRALSVAEIVEQGWDLDHAWESAWAQTEQLEEPDQLEIIDVSGVDVIHMSGPDEFTASLVCSLEQHVGPVGRNGAIVAVPCLDTVLVHPIEGPSSRRAIGTLVPIVRRLHAEGPGSLSPQVYWWRAGRLVWIPTVFGGDTNEVYLPAGLSDVLS